MMSVPVVIVVVSTLISILASIRSFRDERKMRNYLVERSQIIEQHTNELQRMRRGQQGRGVVITQDDQILPFLRGASDVDESDQRDQDLPERRRNNGGDGEEERSAVRHDIPTSDPLDDMVEFLLAAVEYCPRCKDKLSRVMYPERLPEKFCKTMEHGVFVVRNGNLTLVPSGQA